MHHALLIEEILLSIFRYCQRPHSGHANAHLVALARTCKAFKEPALDMIWAELKDLTPLVRCLSSESWATCALAEPGVEPLYSLKKPLEQEDWDIMLGYTHRVRALPRLRGSSGLAVDCIQALSNLPGTTQSIFPNLRVVGLHGPSAMIAPLIRHLINPTVTEILLQGVETLGSAIEGFGQGCPFVNNFRVPASQWARNDVIFGLIRHWKDLHTVHCLSVGLNIDAIRYLSCLHDLHHLSFKVHDAVVDQIQTAPTPILTFLALRDLYLRSPLLTPIGRLLHQLRTPVLNTLSIALDACPTSVDLISSFAAIQRACTHASLNGLSLRVYENNDESTILVENSYYITFDRLRPLSAFVNIKIITLDIPCGVDLSERQLLTLASSWPHLETFELGPDYDWTPSSAITPGGFLQLLGRCRSLRVFYFMFNTRGYTEIPQGHPWRGLRMPKDTFIHMLSSPIDEESVEALGVFFHVAPYPNFNLTTHWNNQYYRGSERSPELCDLYHDRWVQARNLAYELWQERRDLRHSLEVRS